MRTKVVQLKTEPSRLPGPHTEVRLLSWIKGSLPDTHRSQCMSSAFEKREGFHCDAHQQGGRRQGSSLSPHGVGDSGTGWHAEVLVGQVSVRVVLVSDHLHEEIHGQGLQGPIFPDSRSFDSERVPELKFWSSPVLSGGAGGEGGRRRLVLGAAGGQSSLCGPRCPRFGCLTWVFGLLSLKGN